MSNGVARFRVENLREGEVWLEAGGEEVKVQIEKPLTNLVIRRRNPGVNLRTGKRLATRFIKEAATNSAARFQHRSDRLVIRVKFLLEWLVTRLIDSQRIFP